ncbi:MAG: DNA polymerase III subunit alpha, partial [Spirochaetota bacterium]
YINEYIQRLKGKPYRPLLPRMGEILSETCGIMCYQEDITRIAMEVADFPLAEADELRKVISKKNKKERKLELKQKFYRNLGQKNVKAETIDRVWDMIESFSGYSFCKPHSASYALLSFKAGYLKAHYPAEFMGAVLKNQGGYYSPLAYISEARRLGLKIVKPHVNISRYEYFGCKNTVYIGFMQIKNLCRETAKKLVREREENGPYTGVVDFMERTGAGLSDTVVLIKAGCFDRPEEAQEGGFQHYNQPQLLYLAHKYWHMKTRSSQQTLGFYTRGITPPPMSDLPPKQKLKNELQAFGFMVSTHPMEYYRKYLKGCRVILARELHNYIHKTVEAAAILVTAKTVITRNHQLMQFISFEDESAIFETVFFPEVFKKYARCLHQHRPYVLKGVVECEFGAASIQVKEVKPLRTTDYYCKNAINKLC